MKLLHNAVARLESLFSPSPGYSNATAIREVEDEDPRAEAKRALIAAAMAVLDTGKQVLRGGRPSRVSFGEAEFEIIERSLVEDAEQRDFLELATASERVAKLLSSLSNAERSTSCE